MRVSVRDGERVRGSVRPRGGVFGRGAAGGAARAQGRHCPCRRRAAAGARLLPGCARLSPALCSPPVLVWRGEIAASLRQRAREEMPILFFFRVCVCVCVNIQGLFLSL